MAGIAMFQLLALFLLICNELYFVKWVRETWVMSLHASGGEAGV